MKRKEIKKVRTRKPTKKQIADQEFVRLYEFARRDWINR